MRTALVPSHEARIVTEPEEPYRIIHVNENWCRTCGFDAEEVLGQTCKFLHGPGTCGATLKMLQQALKMKRGLAVQLLNYTKKGRPFMNTLQVAPLYNAQGQVTHYLGVIMARFLDGGAAVPPSVQQMSHPANQISDPYMHGETAAAVTGGGGHLVPTGGASSSGSNGVGGGVHGQCYGHMGLGQVGGSSCGLGGGAYAGVGGPVGMGQYGD